MLGARLQKGEHQQAASSILQDLHLLMQKTQGHFAPTAHYRLLTVVFLSQLPTISMLTKSANLMFT